MDRQYYNTEVPKHNKGKHLKADLRATLKTLIATKHGVTEAARLIGCSPNTVRNELKRGTPPSKSNRGRKPGYSDKLGEAVYKANRKACHRSKKIDKCTEFINWVIKQFREREWSIDSCYGHAKLHQLFDPSEMACTRTLYNWIWEGLLPLKVSELPDALRRKIAKEKSRENKRVYGKSISKREEIANLRIEEGHWEGDTIVGKKKGGEAVVLSLLEKKTQYYIAIRIPSKTSESVMEAMQALHDMFKTKFSTVFKTITVDNGSEFADFGKVEEWGTKVYYTHPYSAWERGQNERHNGLFRKFVPKGVSIEEYSEEDILIVSDYLNDRLRKKLGYQTPEELFEEFLDTVYAVQNEEELFYP